MKAIVIGATGATGQDLVRQLLADNAFCTVEIFVRRAVAWMHPKLTVHIIDFDNPETWEPLVTGDVLFSCLRTTLKTAGSKRLNGKLIMTINWILPKLLAGMRFLIMFWFLLLAHQLSRKCSTVG